MTFVSTENKRRFAKIVLPEDTLKPRWISRYVVLSIQKCGNPSLAYDLLLSEMSHKLAVRLRSEARA